jgi:cell division protease FtsH
MILSITTSAFARNRPRFSDNKLRSTIKNKRVRGCIDFDFTSTSLSRNGVIGFNRQCSLVRTNFSEHRRIKEKENEGLRRSVSVRAMKKKNDDKDDDDKVSETDDDEDDDEAKKKKKKKMEEEEQKRIWTNANNNTNNNRSMMLVNRATKIVGFYALVSFMAYAFEAVFGNGTRQLQQQQQVQSRTMTVAYSKFLKDARKNEIQTLSVAGDRLTWKPRQPTVVHTDKWKLHWNEETNKPFVGQKVLKQQTYSVKGKSKNMMNNQAADGGFEIHYAAIKPRDAETPYALLEKNDVELFSVNVGDEKGFDFPFYIFTAVIFLFWLRNFRENQMMNGGSGGVGSRGGMPGGGMPGGIAGAGRQFGSRAGFNGRKDQQNQLPPSTTFADVAGVDEAKEELSEIVDILKNPERYAKLGARPPCGVLLCGSPGTGKTLLARAVAGEAGVPFISVAASEFVELYVGMGASRVRDVFARARAQAPAIVFIDEIDAVAKGRSDGKMRGMGNDEREQTLNQLLTELDGFDQDPSRLVICIGATNRPDTLDAALRRPGRFDRIVQVDKPDVQGRREILDVHVQTRGLPLEKNKDSNKNLLDDIATMTSGFTGADLENLVNEAALLAGRENKTIVGKEEFEKAVLRTVAGVEKKRSLLGPQEKFNVSAHEVGHAIVSQAVGTLLPGSTKPEQISIVARSGGALGFTYTPPNSDEPERKLMFADELRGQIVTFMGGRAAEMIACKRVSTGAMDDIQRATTLAYKGMAEWGLSASVGPISVPALSSGGNPEDWSFGDRAKESGHDVEGEVTGLLNAALVVACETLQYNEALLIEAANVLAKEERVQGDALRAYLERAKAPPSLAKFLEGNYEIPTRADFKRLNTMPLPKIDISKALLVNSSSGEEGGVDADARTAGPR